MVDSGIILIKYWLEVSADEQTRRLESRIDDPRKIWKLSRHGPEVLQPLVRLLAGPATPCSPPPTPSWAPWFVAHNDDKKRGRLNIISHLLSHIPYEPLAPPDVKLPEARSRPATTSSPNLPLHFVPERF